MAKQQREPIIYEYSGEPVKECRGCKAPIFFKLNTKTGKHMPVTKATGQPHWATCPAAGRFKSAPREKKPDELI